jgi:phenylacetate-coenzyme A ligase PaaK-like adenylate-forming protein
VVLRGAGPLAGYGQLEIRVEAGREVVSDFTADMVGFAGAVSDRLTSVLGVRLWVTLVELGATERSAGKAERVLDRLEMD